MGAWAAFVGPGDPGGLARALGPDTPVRSGPGWGLGIVQEGGDPATLTVSPSGQVTAAVGAAGSDAGSAATWDGTHLTLTCDPWGRFRVYTTRQNGVFRAASSLPLLQRLAGTEARLSAAALHGYLCFSWVPAPEAIVSGLCALPAGSRLVVSGPEEQHTEETSWREGSEGPADETEAVRVLDRLLCESVQRQIAGEREAGVFLSGGLDSSLIAALLCRIGVRVHLFALDFGPPFDEELAWAQAVAAHLGRPLHRVAAGALPVRAALTATGQALEQPFGDGVTVPLFLLGRAAAQTVGTVFNGEGGDQLFGGWANKPMLAAGVYGHADSTTAYLETFHRFYGQTGALYGPAARAATGALDPSAWVEPALQADGLPGLLHRLRAANLRLKGAQNIAPRMEQLARAHGLRVRAPFFDRALARATFALPPAWFLHGACEKYILKRVAEPLLPAAVVWRAKRGMGAPVTEWCLGPLRRDVRRRLDGLAHGGWFDRAGLARLWESDDGPAGFRRRRIGERLWTLLMLQVWREAQDPMPRWPE